MRFARRSTCWAKVSESGAAGQRLQPRVRPLLTFFLSPAEVACSPYTGWRVHTPGGAFDCTTNASEYAATIARLAGPQGAAQWAALRARLAPLAALSGALPFAALRPDPLVAFALARFAPALGVAFGGLLASPSGLLGALGELQGSFGDVMAHAGVTSPALRALLELETFVISGCPAAMTPAPEMAFVLGARFGGAPLDHPLGGGRAWVDALVRGITARGGRLLLRAPVERVLTAGGRAAGVELARGRGVVRAPTVICSTSVWDAARLAGPAAGLRADAPECGSFIHLHLGLDATGLDLASIGIHHLVVNDFAAASIGATRNVVNISIPSALDASLAPPGCAVAHVYAAANEPFDDWAALRRGSPEYAALKEERSAVLWAALERVIPDARSRSRLALVGTPLTHARYLRRHRGSYGPALPPGAWPGPATDLPGLLVCGDSTFPGIGIPAAAASGLIAANSLLSAAQHAAVLDAMR